MKFTICAVSFLVAIAPAMAAVTKVNIDVRCNGFNMNKVDVYQATVVANALESSFNEVHGELDDDIELFDVQYGGSLETSTDNLQQYGGYNGGTRCTRCRRDSMLGSPDKSLSGWEAAFVRDLMDTTNHPEFVKIKTCNIIMTPRKNSEQEEVGSTEALSDAETKVNIDVRCSGFNMNKVDVYQATAVASALESSFNDVHSASDDDIELFDVHYGDWSESLADNLQQYGGYNGGTRCTRCRRGSMLGSPDNSLGEWEATFVKGLMGNTNHPEFAKIKSCNIIMTPRNNFEQEEEVTSTEALSAAFTKVNIDVRCSGFNVNKVDVYQATAVASALESSFNDVHSELDDDIELFDVQYGGSLETSADNLQQYGGYNGGTRCTRCRRDSMVGSPDNSLSGWEAAFVRDLVENTNHPEFAKTKFCKIKMTPRGKSEQEEVGSTEALSDSLTKVNIGVQCSGFNMKKVDVYQATAVANALESSFNEVHGEIEDDDIEMFDVHYGTWSDNLADSLQTYSAYNGGTRCTRCRRGAMLESPGNALGEWESAFVKELMENTNHPEFAKIKFCKIKMTPRAKEEEVAELEKVAVKFGLRGCAEAV